MTGPRVLVWNEHVHEPRGGVPAELYPNGIHAAIADRIRERLPDAAVRTGTLADVAESLSAESLESADVLVWWAHLAHADVPDDAVDRVVDAVHRGLGLLVLHSAAESRVFRRLLGTSCTFRWREGDDRELVWVTAPAHPIAAGLPPVLELPRHEMYGEPFDIPRPDDVVFTSWFSGGEVFRSGCTFTRGAGRIFSFSPGHETYPIYHEPLIGDVLANAVRWLMPTRRLDAAPRFENVAEGWWREGGGQTERGS